jgi:uncharacterized protein YkwD
MKCRDYLVLLAGIIFFSGCSSLNYPGYEQVSVPLNAGVTDASFLSSGEMEIAQDIIKARSKSAEAAANPLRLSRGLSFAAKQRAVQVADAGRKESPSQSMTLMERVERFGKVKGRVVEVVSHGYSPRIVVEQLMKQENAPEAAGHGPYFLDPAYTVMGVGCTGDFYPICAITLATDFEEP